MARKLLAGQVKAGDALPELGVDVSATTVILGALATRDWRPMHHDKDFAQNRNGVRDVFMNTPNQAAWFERYVTDWTGPTGRLGRMRFRMHDSVFPNDHMSFQGTVSGVSSDDAGCAWADLDVKLLVKGKAMTTCTVRVALPVDERDNPWQRRGASWKP
jgi:hydroxyacyl-ACP dehydratase HTD2-like protein with hotdog domain